MGGDQTKLANLSEMLYWANGFNSCALLLSNKGGYQPQLYHKYDLILAAGAESELLFENEGDYFGALKDFVGNGKWVFGHLGYDLKNQIERLKSDNTDVVAFPNAYFFEPENLFIIEENKGKWLKQKNNDNDISFQNEGNKNHIESQNFNIQSRVSEKKYIETVNKIQSHIHRGDVFELNYCFEYYIDNIEIDPVKVFLEVNRLSPMPFAAFYKIKNKYLLCFSPERFIKKTGSVIISQPIKGTAKRSSDVNRDQVIGALLSDDLKERTENIMITDLVRNDMSRTAVPGSVMVEELCEVYRFKQVYQMISTIKSEMAKQFHPVDVIKNAFPMGSMTGAPKVRAMELIEEFEASKRGIYSGALGYFTPDNDFDFNVIIRSIAYDRLKKHLSFMVGSAITSRSVPENELEECKLKAKSLTDWLQMLSYEK